MSAVIRKDPPRWAKAAVWVAIAAVAWLGLAVEVMAFLLWPWPTATVTALSAGLVLGALWGRRPLPDVELVHERKDIAIDAAMGSAFELQRISGEHQQVELYQQTDAETLPAPVADDTRKGTLAHLHSGTYGRRL